MINPLKKLFHHRSRGDEALTSPDENQNLTPAVSRSKNLSQPSAVPSPGGEGQGEGDLGRAATVRERYPQFSSLVTAAFRTLFRSISTYVHLFQPPPPPFFFSAVAGFGRVRAGCLSKLFKVVQSSSKQFKVIQRFCRKKGLFIFFMNRPPNPFPLSALVSQVAPAQPAPLSFCFLNT